MTAPQLVASLAAIRDADPASFAAVALARPDIFTRFDPGMVVEPLSPGVIGPARTDTSLPGVPVDVRPGDLIQAGDWNRVLARLRALDPVLANIAESAVALAARVAALEHRVSSIPEPPPVKAAPSDYVEKFLRNDLILRAIAAKPELIDRIVEDPDVGQVLVDNPAILENVIISPAISDPRPELAGGLDVQGAVEAAAVAAGTSTIREQLLGVPAFTRLFAANAGVAERFGVTATELAAAGDAGVALAGDAGVALAGAGGAKVAGAKAGAVKAAGAKAGAAKAAGVAKAAGAKVEGGG
jgi:hypothetical protein